MSILDEISNESFFVAFESSTDPIAVTDTDVDSGFKFIYVNEAFCRHTGYSKEELIGQSPRILQGENTDRHVLDMLKCNILRNENFVGQTSNYKKDGTEFIVKWTVAPLRNNKNEIIAYLSIHKVMTPQVKAVNENLLFHDIIQQAPGMILIVNIDKTILYVNDEYLHYTGYKREELIGRSIVALECVCEDVLKYEDKWDKIYKDGNYSGILKIKKKDGSFFYDKQSVTAIKDKNYEQKCYLILSSDITALRSRLNKKDVLSDLVST